MKPSKLSLLSAQAARFSSFDLLATLVAVVDLDAQVLFANSALEDALGISRRAIEGHALVDHFTEPVAFLSALSGAKGNQFAALRYDAWLKVINHDPIPVHVIVTHTDRADVIVVELLPLEQQTRQDREERLNDQALANKELIQASSTSADFRFFVLLFLCVLTLSLLFLHSYHP